MYEQDPLEEVDARRFVKALRAVAADKEKGALDFAASISSWATERDLAAAFLMKGLTRNSVRPWVKALDDGTELPAPTSKPRPAALLRFLREKTGIDATKDQTLELYGDLDFGIELEIGVEPRNEGELDSPAILKMCNFVFAVEPAFKEHRIELNDETQRTETLELRIGFDRLRLSISGPALKVHGNFICGLEGIDHETSPSDYQGSLRMKAARTHVAWSIRPRLAGALADGWLAAEELCSVSVSGEGSLRAELSVAREALKVRVVRVVDEREVLETASPDIVDIHREAMIQSLIRSDLGNFGERILYSKLLHKV